MGKYLVKCFPSHSTKEQALKSAIEQIRLSRQGTPQNINASGRQREAIYLWHSNLTMSKYYPPLPAHIEQQRITEEQLRYAKHLAKGISSSGYGYGEGRNMGD
ncbi:hypothetical protein [Providencia vermicola]|uniref:hypothetical protein n=1 Tax=Providencia vermicola TaxID=333965 RepID=UPI0034D6D61C